MKMMDMRATTTLAMGLMATLAGATPAVGNIVDTADFSAATFGLLTGTVTDAGTAAGFTVKLQESDTTANASFTDVAAIDLLTPTTGLTVTADTDDDRAIGLLGYRGNKRYIRAVVTGTTGTAAVVTGVWILGCPAYAPSADAAANIAAT